MKGAVEVEVAAPREAVVVAIQPRAELALELLAQPQDFFALRQLLTFQPAERGTSWPFTFGLLASVMHDQPHSLACRTSLAANLRVLSLPGCLPRACCGWRNASGMDGV